MEWFDLPETPYRASQICRVLGNPKAYQILRELRRLGSATPSDLAPLLHRDGTTVSAHLRSLREVQMVRYTRRGKEAVYRLKTPEVGKLLDRLEAIVVQARRMK